MDLKGIQNMKFPLKFPWKIYLTACMHLMPDFKTAMLAGARIYISGNTKAGFFASGGGKLCSMVSQTAIHGLNTKQKEEFKLTLNLNTQTKGWIQVNCLLLQNYQKQIPLRSW